MGMESWVRWELGAGSAGRWMLEALEALGDGCGELGAGSTRSTGRWVLGMLEILGTGCGCWERWLMPAGSTGSWVLGAQEALGAGSSGWCTLGVLGTPRARVWRAGSAGMLGHGMLGDGCWMREAGDLGYGCWELSAGELGVGHWEVGVGMVGAGSWALGAECWGKTPFCRIRVVQTSVAPELFLRVWKGSWHPGFGMPRGVGGAGGGSRGWSCSARQARVWRS